MLQDGLKMAAKSHIWPQDELNMILKRNPKIAKEKPKMASNNVGSGA
jgi:hypothetical protein